MRNSGIIYAIFGIAQTVLASSILLAENLEKSCAVQHKFLHFRLLPTYEVKRRSCLISCYSPQFSQLCVDSYKVYQDCMHV